MFPTIQAILRGHNMEGTEAFTVLLTFHADKIFTEIKHIFLL